MSWTAFSAARGRAQESLRADRLFDDRLAGVFVEEAIAAQARDGAEGLTVRPVHPEGISRLADIFSYYFMIRTPFYDERVMRAVGAGCRQVVLLGAGLDSRAFRLGLPADVTVFEVDQGPVLEFKDAVLAKHDAVPTSRRHVCPGSRFASEYFVRPPAESDVVDDSSSARDRARWRSVLDMFGTGPVAASPAAWVLHTVSGGQP